MNNRLTAIQLTTHDRRAGVLYYQAGITTVFPLFIDLRELGPFYLAKSTGKCRYSSISYVRNYVLSPKIVSVCDS